MDDCPRCSDQGIIVYMEGVDEEAYRIVVPWSLIEDTIAGFVRDAAEGLTKGASDDDSDESLSDDE